MNLLLTGASGFLGKALTPKLIARGDTIYGLSRHPPEMYEGLVPLVGDVVKPNLGLTEAPKGIKAVYHLAAIHRLGEDKDGSIWETNVTGTKNVIQFCKDHNIPKLFFCSTAFTVDGGRNTYERSKILCEEMVLHSDIPHVTVYKPPLIMGTKEHPYSGHYSQFVILVIRVHKRVELIRRKLEGTLRLPVLTPGFRIKGDPNGTLNMVTIDDVVDGMYRIRRKGKVWLTHPNPPTLGQLVAWTGEFVLLDMKTLPHFKPTPIELAFQKLSSAFIPYVYGDHFPSDLKNCLPITKEFIFETMEYALFTIDKGGK